MNQPLTRREKTVLISVLALLLMGATAAPPTELVIGIYDSDTGHHADFKSYKYIMKMTFDSDAECEFKGAEAQDSFKEKPDARRLTTGLMDYVCVKVKP